MKWVCFIQMLYVFATFRKIIAISRSALPLRRAKNTFMSQCYGFGL